jgi:GGDEF domain-containing protein
VLERNGHKHWADRRATGASEGRDVTAADTTDGHPSTGVSATGPPGHDLPPDVAGRVLAALDRGPSGFSVLIDEDLTVRWASRSGSWLAATDEWVGRYSLDWVHPDDVQRILDALAQRPPPRPEPPGGGPGRWPLPPLRYRIRGRDGGWLAVEALVQDLLDDPAVRGFLVTARPVGGEIGGVGAVLDLLAGGAPLVEVLTACARLVPDYLGAAAVVGLLDADAPEPPSTVVGVAPGTAAARLVADERWWRPTVEDGKPRTTAGFVDVPDDLAAAARDAGFQSVWTLPLLGAGGEVLGCAVVWALIAVDLNMANEEGLRQAARLASLVIGERHRHVELRRAAQTDPLTRLGNRSLLRRRLDRATGPVTVALVDLDGFKPVNDRYGHDAGDHVLTVVAERLVAAVREDDCVVRFGGDEFAVVFAEPVVPREPGDAPPASEGPGGGPDAAERLRVAVERPITVRPGTRVTVGASVGLATAPAGQVVQLADRDLYRSKRARRGERHT